MKRLLFIGVYFFFVFALSAQNNEISTSQIVDLGLSVKWAGWNIGASAPEQYGGLYGWADPSGKKVSGNENEYPSENPPINICGTKYDIAYIQWGKDWRLPTIEEMQELMNKCKWKWISYRKTNGYKVTGPNGNSIFLPAGGRRSGWLGGKILQEGIVYDKSKEGYYITGSSYSTTHNVPHLYFHSGRYDQATDSRSLGYSVRPVMGTSNLTDTKVAKENTKVSVKKAEDLKFDVEKINLKAFTITRKRSLAFNFTNVGDTTLVVLKAITSCPCLKIDKVTKVVEPGQKGSIELTFDGERMSVGRFAKSVMIFTNFNREKRKDLLVEGYLTPEGIDPNEYLRQEEEKDQEVSKFFKDYFNKQREN